MLTCFLSMLYCRSWQVLCTLWVLLKYHCRMCTLYTVPVVYPSWMPCPWGEDESVGARERLLCVLPRFCIWCVLLYLFSSIFIPKKKWTKIKNTLIGLVFFHDMQMEYGNCSWFVDTPTKRGGVSTFCKKSFRQSDTLSIVGFTAIFYYR